MERALHQSPMQHPPSTEAPFKPQVASVDHDALLDKLMEKIDRIDLQVKELKNSRDGGMPDRYRPRSTFGGRRSSSPYPRRSSSPYPHRSSSPYPHRSSSPYTHRSPSPGSSYRPSRRDFGRRSPSPGRPCRDMVNRGTDNEETCPQNQNGRHPDYDDSRYMYDETRPSRPEWQAFRYDDRGTSMSRHIQGNVLPIVMTRVLKESTSRQSENFH
nr:uncharacterized protein LOC129260710 [Lytechinus pictus]